MPSRVFFLSGGDESSKSLLNLEGHPSTFEGGGVKYVIPRKNYPRLPLLPPVRENTSRQLSLLSNSCPIVTAPW